MEKLTEERAKDLHIKMWTELRNSGKYKSASKTREKYRPLNGCFMCEFCIIEGSDSERPEWDCGKCLVEWVPGNKSRLSCPCEDDDSPYADWKDADTAGTRKKFAQKILDLPWIERIPE